MQAFFMRGTHNVWSMLDVSKHLSNSFYSKEQWEGSDTDGLERHFLPYAFEGAVREKQHAVHNSKNLTRALFREFLQSHNLVSKILFSWSEEQGEVWKGTAHRISAICINLVLIFFTGEKLSKQQLHNSNIIKKLRAKEKERENTNTKQNKKIKDLEEELQCLKQVRYLCGVF